MTVTMFGIGSSVWAQERPNVLFLFADDQRADTIAAYGNAHIRTPNLDALVERGFSFRNAYCMGSWHGAVCVPSRAMLMTGRNLFRVENDMAGATTLPQLLDDNGYTTFATGKWHNERPAFRRSFQRGEAIMFGGMANHEAVPLVDFRNGEFTDQRTGEGHSSALFADAAVEFLSTYNSDDPFFAYVAFTAPHDPRQPPDDYRAMYYDDLPPLPPNYLPQHPFNNGWLIGRDENLGAWPRSESLVRDQLAEYYALITHLDDQIGRILRALDASGRAGSTIVVYAADHGLAVGSHGLLGKQSIYEHSMRAPLIVAGPGIAHGESNAFAYLFDLFPTLCDYLGADVPDGVEGKSLRPVITAETGAIRDTIFLAYEDSQRAVREGEWKLIRYPKINHTQLFNLARDPHEIENLADRPESQERIDWLMERLREMQHKAGDTAPLSTDAPAPFAVDLTNTPREPDQWQPDWIVEKYFH
jgi:arylsulfatase A-like enzyme